MPSTLDISPTKDLMLNICKDTVQNNTGENNNVTDKKHLLVAYDDIEPYPIGGVKAEDVAIMCIGKGLLPWLSKEGKFTMVETLYGADVDGSSISPTTVIQKHIHLYQGFTINSNIYNEEGEIKLIHRNEVQHVI